MNYHNKKFRPETTSPNGEVDDSVIFHYQQTNNVLTCTYSGSNIVSGHLIGLVDANGSIDMRYHQVNTAGELMTGTCQSAPELLPNGKLRLRESWRWTSGDVSAGISTLIEL